MVGRGLPTKGIVVAGEGVSEGGNIGAVSLARALFFEGGALSCASFSIVASSGSSPSMSTSMSCSVSIINDVTVLARELIWTVWTG